MDKQVPPPEFATNLYDNVFKIWANPEIERRRATGKVPEDYKPWAVQVFMDPIRQNEVRFDDEIDGVFYLDPTLDAPDGEPVNPLTFHEIAKSIIGFELSGEDSVDTGHITLVRHRESFYVAFDLQYNSARIADHVQTAREFLNGAKLSLDQRQMRVFTANLYQAVELLAKSSLFKLTDKRLVTASKHTHIRSEYNRHSRTGITDAQYVPLLNKLFDLRNPARYPDRPFSLDVAEAEEMLATAEQMFEAVLACAPQRTQRLLQQPAYQNPEGAQQAELGRLEAAPKQVVKEAAKAPWPRTLPERMKAVQEAVAASDRPVSPEEVAARFKRAQWKQVGEHLETLEALGLLQRTEDGRYVA